ncbi:MAG: SHOCT domain-containing protein [Bacteroidaceae bacterium]|nr:SHOCT domain-containing protein [Bacteroidaceae bacterium]
MEVLIIVIIVFGIIKAVSDNNERNKNIEKRGESFNQKLYKQENFNTTNKIIGVENTYVLAIDQSKKMIMFMTEHTKKSFPFNQLLSVEVLEDNLMLLQKSSLRTIGGAVVGGAIAGGAGAIVGGLSGDSKQNKKVSKVQVKIKLRDINNPSFTIDCFDCKTMTLEGKPIKPTSLADGEKYKQGLKDAQLIADTLSVIIDDVDRAEKKSQNTSTIPNNISTNSIANELAKLAELKEKGILTEDEFNAQKKILLNNQHS